MNYYLYLLRKKNFELETFEKTAFFVLTRIMIFVLRKISATESADFRSLHKSIA